MARRPGHPCAPHPETIKAQNVRLQPKQNGYGGREASPQKHRPHGARETAWIRAAPQLLAACVCHTPRPGGLSGSVGCARGGGGPHTFQPRSAGHTDF